MKLSSNCFAGFLILISCISVLRAQEKSGKTRPVSKHITSIERSARLQTILDEAVAETLEKFRDRNFKPEQFAATVIDLGGGAGDLKIADFRGEERIYPASVVKMFYMAALFEQVESGRVKMTPELERGLKEMIEVSSNDATHYIFDVLTGTSGGAELSAEELEQYAYKKNAVNRYFSSLGYRNINVNQKTYCEDIFGRERQFWDGGKQRNKLTTNATAKLLANIALGRAVSEEKSRSMMELMKREPFSESDDKDNQSVGYTGIALKNLGMKDARLFSKAGWTSASRHDAAYVETPDGLKFVLVVFTDGHANERGIIPSVAEKVIKGLKNNN